MPTQQAAPWQRRRALSCRSSQERIRSKERIRSNIEQLGQLADKCERLNSSISQAITESHRILDDPLHASKAHLKQRMVTLNYNAFADIHGASSAYSEYIQAMQDLVGVDDSICEDIFRRLEVINKMAKLLFE
jgi:hypothetical protein